MRGMCERHLCEALCSAVCERLRRLACERQCVRTVREMCERLLCNGLCVSCSCVCLAVCALQRARECCTACTFQRVLQCVRRRACVEV